MHLKILLVAHVEGLMVASIFAAMHGAYFVLVCKCLSAIIIAITVFAEC